MRGILQNRALGQGHNQLQAGGNVHQKSAANININQSTPC